MKKPMAKQGRISMTTVDGKFNFTPSRTKGKYCVVRIYDNVLKLDNQLPLKDNTKNLNPLPSCHSEGDYLKEYKVQFAFALHRLNEIYEDSPDSFVRFDKTKKKYVINTKKLTALVYENRARSKSRNEMMLIPVRKEVAGKELFTIGNVPVVDTELRQIDLTEVEKEKVREAEKINNYFGIKNTHESILKEVSTRKQNNEIKAEIERRHKKYGDKALITDGKIIKEILSEGEFVQTNLYLLSCAITNLEKNAEKFSHVLVRLREYNLRHEKILTTKDLTFEGIKKFVLFFVDNGIKSCKTQGMTPFNYRNEKFLERIKRGAPLEPTDETWRKFFIYLKKLLGLLNKEDLLKSGWEKDSVKRLDQISKVSDEGEYGIEYSSLSSNTRQNYYLTKDEVDKIFKLKLKNTLETKKNPVSGYNYTVGYSKEDLTLTRDMFVCMTWLGGLRPIEYNPKKVDIMKMSDSEYNVNYITSEKNKKEVCNPVFGYAYDTLKKYKFQIPYVKIDSLEFKKRLQAILQQAKIDREIIKIESRGGKHKKMKVNIQDAIYRYFARHTFNQFLIEAGFSDDQRARFTGHSIPNVSLEAYGSKHVGVKRMWLKEKNLI